MQHAITFRCSAWWCQWLRWRYGWSNVPGGGEGTAKDSVTDWHWFIYITYPHALQKAKVFIHPTQAPFGMRGTKFMV